MQHTGASPAECENVSQHINHVFSELSEERREQVRSGKPDTFTTFVMAELLLNVISSDGDPQIPHSCVQALGVTDSPPSTINNSLNHLLSREREEVVSAQQQRRARPLEGPLEGPQQERITPPSRLNQMTGHFGRMLAHMMKTGLCRPTGPTCSTSPRVHSVEDAIMSACSWEPDGQSAEVQRILSREVSSVLDPYLEATKAPQRKSLSLEIAQDIKDTSRHISEVIGEKMDGAGDKSNRSFGPALKTIRTKIQALFTKSFARVMIQRIKAQLGATLRRETRDSHSSSLQPIVDTIGIMLETKYQESATQRALVPLFQQDAADLVYTDGLNDLLYCHLLDWMKTMTVPESPSSRNVVLPCDAEALIASKVWVFISLVNWWNAQVTRRTHHTVLALLAAFAQGTDAGAALDSQETFDPKELLARSKKASVSILTDKLVWRLFRRTKTFPRDISSVGQNLLLDTWAEVGAADLFLAADHEKHCKNIYKELHKHFGDQKMFLWGLQRRDPVIASTIARHVTTTLRPQSAVSRFFSALGRGLSKPFRRDLRVVVDKDK